MKSSQRNLVALLLVPIVFIFADAVHAQHVFEKGDAICRRADALLENTIGPILGIENVGHAALYRDWHVSTTFQVSSVEMNQQRIIEMQGDGMHTDRTVQFSIDVVGHDNFWGPAYYVSLPGLKKLSATQRRAVIATALSFTNAEYGFFSNDSWIQGGYKDPNHTPPRFRCDGLVEYAYEIALGHNWQPGNNGGIVPDDTDLTMWPALQYNSLTPRTTADKPIIVVKDPDGDIVSDGDIISDHNVTLEATDGDEGSGISRLEVWRGPPSEGGTEVVSLRNNIDYDVDHSYSLNLPGGELYLRLFDQAGNESLFNVNIEQSIDLVFVIDTTGSMWDDIAAAKTSAIDIVNQIDLETDDYRIAVVSFEDFPVYPYGDSSWGDYMYHDILNFSTDKTSIVSAIQSLFTRNGMDWPESHYSALMHCFQKDAIGGWRGDVKKVAIVMTDAPPHDPEPFTGYTGTDVTNAAVALDPVIIYPIVVGSDSIARSYMESLAEGTGGQVFDAANSGEVVEAIMAAIETTFNAPIAIANGPYSGKVGSSITFDGSGSYDPDGEIVSYEWDFDSDGIYDTVGITPYATYTYSAEYTGLVKLRVTDNDGLTSIGAASVEILGDIFPPEVEIIIPVAGTSVQDGVILTAEATDISGISELYFYILETDGESLFPTSYENLIATYNMGKWEYYFDTTQLPDGNYMLGAKAIDPYGNEGVSELVLFSIRNWAILELLPASKSYRAGRTMPVKFSLKIAGSVDPAMPYVYNEELEIRIYKFSDPGNILQKSMFGDSSMDYRIDSIGGLYITNFKTDIKPAEYNVEIWRTSKNFLIGNFSFKTEMK